MECVSVYTLGKSSNKNSISRPYLSITIGMWKDICHTFSFFTPWSTSLEVQQGSVCLFKPPSPNPLSTISSQALQSPALAQYIMLQHLWNLQMHIEYCIYMGVFLAIKHLYCMFLYFILMNLIIGALHQFFTKYPIDCSEPAFCNFVKELTESEWFSTLAFSDTCTLLIKSKGINNT